MNLQSADLTVKIVDFGSAVHHTAAQEAGAPYGEQGPSDDELTLNYAPPEVVFRDAASGDPQAWLPSYDVWSAGVVMLELIMGTSEVRFPPTAAAYPPRLTPSLSSTPAMSGEVFQIDDRARAIINHRLRGSPRRVLEAAYLLRALTEYCVYPPKSIPRDKMSPALARAMLHGEYCTPESFAELIRARDPFGRGLRDPWGVKLLRQILTWNPRDRIDASKALKHAYLREGGSQGFRCPGWRPGDEEFEFEEDMRCPTLPP